MKLNLTQAETDFLANLVLEKKEQLHISTKAFLVFGEDSLLKHTLETSFGNLNQFVEKIYKKLIGVEK